MENFRKILKLNSENDEFQIIESLKLNRAKRAKNHEIFIEGIESIKQAIAAKLEISRIIISNSGFISGWAENIIGNSSNTKIIELSPELYKKLCDKNEPSEMVITAKVKPKKLEDIQLSESPFIVLFDRPGDSGNLGTIIRTANSFNVEALLVMGHSVDIYDPKVIRASLGNIFHTQIIQIESMNGIEEFIRKEKQRNNIKIAGTDSDGPVSLRDHSIKRPIMIVIGNEAKGMSVGLKNLCDEIIRIPLSGNANSLNVAVAAGIFMWEVEAVPKTEVLEQPQPGGHARGRPPRT
jgi:TrmH family RNA methyltransferase